MQYIKNINNFLTNKQIYNYNQFNNYDITRNKQMIDNANNFSKLLKDVNFNNLKKDDFKLKLKNIYDTYELKCSFCNTTNVIMNEKYVLQECLDCKNIYIPKILELK